MSGDGSDLGGIMKIRNVVAALASSLALAVAVPALAVELREPKAHLIIDLPDGWETSTEGAWIHSHPKDNSFHLHVKGVDHKVWKTEKEFEEGVVVYYAEHLNNVTITEHAKFYADWHGFRVHELRGKGTRKSDGKEVKFFLLLLRDNKDLSKGAIALASGTPEGFEKHHKGIYEAFHTLRTY
jgi:hypothetical protein